MLDHERIRITKLAGTRYARVLAYPSSDEMKIRKRVKELSALGISRICFTGSSLIDGIPVLGKGCVGVVVLAELDGISVALKIRRDDADRPTMVNEGRLLRFANSVEVGPQLISATRDFLVMEFVNGTPLFKWAESLNPPTKHAVREVLNDLLWACFKLDAIGLDHGELSHAPKNVLVDKVGAPCIVDFESASTTRRVANVTSLLQYFMFGRISREISASEIFPKKRKMLKILSLYKQGPSVENFRTILQALRLE